MSVALYTTLIGVIGYLWLSLLTHLLGGDDAARN